MENVCVSLISLDMNVKIKFAKIIVTEMGYAKLVNAIAKKDLEETPAKKRYAKITAMDRELVMMEFVSVNLDSKAKIVLKNTVPMNVALMVFAKTMNAFARVDFMVQAVIK